MVDVDQTHHNMEMIVYSCLSSLIQEPTRTEQGIYIIKKTPKHVPVIFLSIFRWDNVYKFCEAQNSQKDKAQTNEGERE